MLTLRLLLVLIVLPVLGGGLSLLLLENGIVPSDSDGSGDGAMFGGVAIVAVVAALYLAHTRMRWWAIVALTAAASALTIPAFRVSASSVSWAQASL